MAPRLLVKVSVRTKLFGPVMVSTTDATWLNPSGAGVTRALLLVPVLAALPLMTTRTLPVGTDSLPQADTASARTAKYLNRDVMVVSSTNWKIAWMLGSRTQ